MDLIQLIAGAVGGDICLLGGIGFAWMATARWVDTWEEPISVTDPVTKKSAHNVSVDADGGMVYHISVAEIEFVVTKQVFDSWSVGDMVQVTYWPHSNVVVSVDRALP